MKIRPLSCLAGIFLCAATLPPQLEAADPVWEWFAGATLGSGTIDGNGVLARMYQPQGVARDADGNVYVADTGNHTIRKVTPAGVVTTLAGKARESGSADGQGENARFSSPKGLAIDDQGNVLVADFGNHTIRKISPEGVVQTVAGQTGVALGVDGPGADARFDNPTGIIFGQDGNFYIADMGNHTIRQMTPAFVVSTVAGSHGISGTENGAPGDARFKQPTGVARAADGSLYVADCGNYTIRKIAPSGVTTVAGVAGEGGFRDGSMHLVHFTDPYGIVVADDGSLLVSEPVGRRLRRITATTGSTVLESIRELAGIALDPSGDILAADRVGHAVVKVTPAGVVTPVAGGGSIDYSSTVGGAMTIDPKGTVYTAFRHSLNKVTALGQTTHLGGNYMVTEPVYGDLKTQAQYGQINGITRGKYGRLYVTDIMNLVRRITPYPEEPSWTDNRLTGNVGSGATDGTLSEGRFFWPIGIATDSRENLYVADSVNHMVRKITLNPQPYENQTPWVSTLAGAEQVKGSMDGPGGVARFDTPYGIAVNQWNGDVFVTDSKNHTIRKISQQGEVTTIAGAAGVAGDADGLAANARFREPSGIAIDSAGNLYIADKGNHLVRKLDTEGNVTTLGGMRGRPGVQTGVGGEALFTSPTEIAVTPGGDLYVSMGQCIMRGKIDLATAAPTMSTLSGTTSKNPHHVEYVLPEQAAEGAVKLTFEGPVTRSFTVAESVGSPGGASQVKFDAANPTQLGWLISEEAQTALPDGVYTVRLSYRDIVGNPVASGQITGYRIDNTAPTVTAPASVTLEAESAAGKKYDFAFGATDDGSGLYGVVAEPPSGTVFPIGVTQVIVGANDVVRNYANAIFTVTVEDTTAPTATLPGLITLSADESGYAILGDLTGQVTATDLVTAVPEVTQLTEPATVLALGSHTVQFKLRDEAENERTVSTTVVVSFTRPADPVSTPGTTAGPVVKGEAKGDAVPEDSGLPEGASYGAFFTPAISDFRDLVARVTVIAGTKKLAAIHAEDGGGEARIVAAQNGQALGTAGVAIPEVTFKSFLDPIVAPGGAIAFGAKLQGKGAKGGDDGVWTDLFHAGEPRLIVREGEALPDTGGAKVKAITSVSLRDTGLLASVTLAAAKNLVTSADDAVLAVLTDAQTGGVLLREGRTLGGEAGTKIKSFSVLQPASASAGHGRWHGDDTVLAKVTLATGEVRLVSVDQNTGLVTTLLTTLAEAEAVADGAHWKSFGVPAAARDGALTVTSAILKLKDGGVTAKDDTALLFRGESGDWEVLARESGEAPIEVPVGTEAVRYATFFDPVVNDAGQIAFYATFQGNAAAVKKNKGGLLCGSTGHFLVVAPLGGSAPDAAGDTAEGGPKFSKFLSYALPSGDDAGVVFLAEVAGGGATAKTKLGLWGQDSSGKVRELLRAGAPLVEDGPVLTTFTLLTSLPGSFGATRSFNATGSVAVLATFADKTQSLLRIDLP